MAGVAKHACREADDVEPVIWMINAVNVVFLVAIVRHVGLSDAIECGAIANSCGWMVLRSGFFFQEAVVREKKNGGGRENGNETRGGEGAIKYPTQYKERTREQEREREREQVVKLLEQEEVTPSSLYSPAAHTCPSPASGPTTPAIQTRRTHTHTH